MTDAPAAFSELAIWPENWAPLQVFRRMESQKNIAPNGFVLGLNYGPLPFVLRALQVPESDWPDLMDCFQIMEAHMVKLLLKNSGATPHADDEEPIFLEDPVAHSNLIRAAMFGIKTPTPTPTPTTSE